MLQGSKTNQEPLRIRNTIKLPAVFTEANELVIGNKIEVTHGTNFSCVVIHPVGVKLGKLQRERIDKLCCEPLETER